MNNATASNPGELRVQVLRWFKHYPKWPLIWGSIAIALALATWLVHWAFAFPLLLLLLFNYFYWNKVRKHFEIGNALPGIVLQIDPMLIAVAADLSVGQGEYPAILVFEKRLSAIAGQPPTKGAELATVALYYEDEDPEVKRWGEFDPRPVDCATSDVAAIERITATFDEEDRTFLRECLECLDQPYTPGLHHLSRDQNGQLRRGDRMVARPS